MRNNEDWSVIAMVRKKNKGFSLIEVVVAVAILTLLISPILAQVIQTLSVSAAAKEKQYAVENAEYVLNYMQETQISKLNLLSSKLTGTISTNSDGSVKTENIDGKLQFSSVNTVSDQACIPYICGTYADMDTYLARSAVSSTAVTSAFSAPLTFVEYSATTYTLDQAKLGKKKNIYNRKVTLDNLRAQLAGKGLTVETNFSAEAINYLKEHGFEITTEGAAVKYNAQGLVVGILCSSVVGVESPNGIGTSYMQDLDSTKVAIIQGAASNFDAQAENDLYNLKMNRLKAANPNAWVQAMNSQTGSTILNTTLFNDNVSKLTKITLVSGVDTSRPAGQQKFYDVDCIVYYEDYLAKNPAAATGGAAGTDAAAGISDMTTDLSVPDVLTYSAYSHRFYTNQAPDVYLIYEPYVADGKEYASKDFIATYDGIEYGPEDKHAKMYIIKPNNSRIAEKIPGKRTFYTSLNSTSNRLVDINVNQLKRKTGGNDPMVIYTNVDLDNFSVDKTDNPSSKTGVCYASNRNEYYGVTKSSATGDVNKSDRYAVDTDITREAYPDDAIKDITEDVTLSDRVYTVTVQLDRLDKDGNLDSGNSIKLSGAKGAE